MASTIDCMPFRLIIPNENDDAVEPELATSATMLPSGGRPAGPLTDESQYVLLRDDGTVAGTLRCSRLCSPDSRLAGRRL